MFREKLEKSDKPGVFKIAINSEELSNIIESQTGLFRVTRHSPDGTIEEGIKQLPLPLVGQIFVINEEKYQIIGYAKDLMQGSAELYLMKYIKAKPKHVKRHAPAYIRVEECDYRWMAPLEIMIYNDMWNDISIYLEIIKDIKEGLDKFLSQKRHRDHLDSDNQIRFSNAEEAIFRGRIKQLYSEVREIFETIPASFLVSNYTIQLSDSQRQSKRPKTNFKNLKKTNPNFQYPVPFNIVETNRNISITPYQGNFLTQKIIEKKYGYCGRTGHIINPLGNEEDEVGHTSMDRYNKIDYFIGLIEPLVNGHAFIIGEDKPTIFMYVTGKFTTQMLYPYGEISMARIRLNNKTYDDVKENGYSWPLHT